MDVEKKEFILILLIIAVFSIVYAVYTIPAQVATGKGIPYPDPRLKSVDEDSWTKTGPRILSAFILFSVLSIFLAVVLMLVWRSWQLYGGERKHILKLFGKALGFYLAATLGASISLLVFLYFQKSYIIGEPLSFAYPVLLPITYALSAVAAYYTFKFSYWLAMRDEPSFVRKMTILIPLFILLVIMTSPYNWYGAYTLDENIPNIRPITNAILFIIILLAIIQAIMLIRFRMNLEQDPVNKARIKTIMLGFLLVLAIYIFNVTYEIFLTKALVIFIATYTITAIAVILVYLGLTAPKWYLDWLSHRVSKS